MRIENVIVTKRDVSHAGIIGEGIVEVVYTFDGNGVERMLLYLLAFAMIHCGDSCWTS